MNSKLRYRGWTFVPIGQLCTLVNGRAFNPKEWVAAGTPIIRIQNLNDPSKPFNYYAGAYNSKHFVTSGDVLLSWSGTPRTSFGCFVWNGPPGVLNQHIFKVNVNNAECIPEYFVFAVNSILDEMIDQAHGGVGLCHITKSKLQRIEVPVAPLQQQRGIVARLQTAFAIIQQCELLMQQMEQEAKRLQLAVFSDCLSNFSPADIVQTRLGDVVHKLQYRSSAKASRENSGVPILCMSNIQDGQLIFEAVKYSQPSQQELKKFRLVDGDVLINRTNSKELVGKAAVFRDAPEGAWTFASYLIRLAINSEKAIPEFISAVVNSHIGRGYIEQKARRAIGMVNINAKEIGDMVIPLPSMDKQQLVVSKLKEASLISSQMLEAVSIDELKALRESVLRTTFHGEL